MRIRRSVTAVAVAAAASLAVAGCSPASPSAGPAQPVAPSVTATREPAPVVRAPTITASVTEGASLPPGTPLTLSLDSGTLATVVLRDETAGTEITAGTAATGAPAGTTDRRAGAVIRAGTVLALDAPPPTTALRTWSPSTPLVPGRSYSLTAVATVPGGPSATLRRAFSVAAPEATLKAEVTPSEGVTVGVGYPLIVTFNKTVKDRAAVEKALRVETSRAVGEASWSWVSGKEIHYRPKNFWPADTTITVHLALAGVQASGSVWAQRASARPSRPGAPRS